MDGVVDEMDDGVFGRDVQVGKAAIQDRIAPPVVGGHPEDLGHERADDPAVGNDDDAAAGIIGQDGLERAQDPTMEIPTRLAAWPTEIVVERVVHPRRDLRMLGFDPSDGLALERPEVHLGELRHDDRLHPETPAHDLSGHEGALKWTREQNVRLDLIRDALRDAIRLSDTEGVEGSVHLPLQDPPDVAVRPAVPDQIEGRFTIRWMTKVDMGDEIGWE